LAAEAARAQCSLARHSGAGRKRFSTAKLVIQWRQCKVFAKRSRQFRTLQEPQAPLLDSGLRRNDGEGEWALRLYLRPLHRSPNAMHHHVGQLVQMRGLLA